MEKVKAKLQKAFNPEPEKYKTRLYNSISILVIAWIFKRFITMEEANRMLHVFVYVSCMLYATFYAALNFSFFKNKNMKDYLKVISVIISITPIAYNIYNIINLK